MVTAQALTKALRGKWNGSSGTVRCPCHEDRLPSLSIRDGDTAPLFKCFAGCESRDVAAEFRRRGYLGGRGRDLHLDVGGRVDREPSHSRDPAWRVIPALRIWEEARDIRGTPGWTYLHNRGVGLETMPNLAHGLRWHFSCPWGGGSAHTCIVALWTDIRTGEPRAIHRRPINSAGKAVAHWHALGPTTECVIRLWSDGSVTDGLVLGEGIETVLVATSRVQHRGTLLQPAWAAGDAGHVATFPALPGIEALTILVDHDAAGQNAAARCAGAWTAAGREVTRLMVHHPGADFADLVEVQP